MNTIVRTLEAGEGDAGIDQQLLAEFPGLTVVRATSRSDGLSARTESIPAAAYRLIVLLRGSRITQAADGRFNVVVPPRSLLYGRGPRRITSFLGRGDHESLVVTWQADQAQALDRWSRAYSAGRSAQGEGTWAIRAIPPEHRALPERLLGLCLSDGRGREVSLYALLHDVVVEMLTSVPRLRLNGYARQDCRPLEELIAAVEATPHRSWTLEEAGEVAGYSPFHLSRTFKNLYGYGFPEYVDRCRTAVAVRVLVESLDPVDDVAEQCGFGSGQALRAAVKAYLGILPAEIRRLANLMAPVT